MAAPLGEERRAALLQVKVRALARQQWDAGGDAGPFPSGATLFDAATARAWVLAEQPDHRVLGQALAWGLWRGVSALHLLLDGADLHDGVDGVAGIVARRAAAFATPVTSWRVDGRDVAPADPALFPPPVPLPDDAAALAAVLRAHGAEPVVEHGVLTGEVLGLEVARIVTGDGPARLEVGVGRHDREAQHLLFPERRPEDALDHAVATVRRLRVDGAQPHLANTLATERWLRSVVVAHPELVAASHLEAVPPPVRSDDLRRPTPASACGLDDAGRPLVVTCSTGTDLDAVPSAADARIADGRPGCRVVVAVPPDAHRVTRAMAADLRDPAEVIAVPERWRLLSPVA
jgi:hypothetical protein